MTREFQVLYREVQKGRDVTNDDGKAVARFEFLNPVPAGPVLTVNAVAEDAEELRAEFTAAGLQVISVHLVRCIVDWSKPYLNREEFAYAFSVEPDTVSKNKGTGAIPCSKIGFGVYPRAWIERMVLNKANEEGKRIAKQIAAA
jgi:hypothetical protein